MRNFLDLIGLLLGMSVRDLLNKDNRGEKTYLGVAPFHVLLESKEETKLNKTEHASTHHLLLLTGCTAPLCYKLMMT